MLRVLMLGWEYPPHISGGLGTACEGLTTALANQAVKVLFVVPHLAGGESAAHMKLVDISGSEADYTEGEFYQAFGRVSWSTSESSKELKESISVKTKRVPAALKPYWGVSEYEEFSKQIQRQAESVALGLLDPFLASTARNGFSHYGSDIFEEVELYALRIASLFSRKEFDVVHGHDWMTFPAAVALSQITGRPLVLHVHSLEYDRSGAHPNHKIESIERWGLQQADAVIAVSHYTRRVIVEQYGIPEDRIAVVHNGVYPRKLVKGSRESALLPGPMVLFLGRITFQKGPDYFVEAAAKVIPHVPDVTFVVAGSGDMLPRLINRVQELGIESHFRFPGFLRGSEVEQIFSAADLYVMPSVSEPFGISALEAISYETPVIISRQSGVSEVLRHVLKVDFWDVDKMADLMVNALLYDELRGDMVSMAKEEIKRLRWGASAKRTIEVYRSVLSDLRGTGIGQTEG